MTDDQTDDAGNTDAERKAEAEAAANAAWRRAEYFRYVASGGKVGAYAVKIGGAKEIAGAIAFAAGSEAVQILELRVAPDERRRGVGKALAWAVLELASVLDVDTEALVDRDNRAARQLFDDLGFRMGLMVSLLSRRGDDGDAVGDAAA